MSPIAVAISYPVASYRLAEWRPRGPLPPSPGENHAVVSRRKQLPRRVKSPLPPSPYAIANGPDVSNIASPYAIANGPDVSIMSPLPSSSGIAATPRLTPTVANCSENPSARSRSPAASASPSAFASGSNVANKQPIRFSMAA